MSEPALFRVAAQLLTGGDGLVSLAAPFAALLPGMSAAVSVLGDPFGVQTVAASDAVAVRCAEAQIDIGEGPIWTAYALQRSLLLPDVSVAAVGWPVFSAVLAERDVRSVFAFPMVLGGLRVGVVSLYRTGVQSVVPPDLADTLLLVQMVARRVLQYALDEADGAAHFDAREFLSRREVHQATGMVLAQLGVSAEEALLLIRAHAFASGRTVRDVAHAIVTRELDLSATGDVR